eukprot:2429441-Rhodomonas_salina.1
MCDVRCAMCDVRCAMRDVRCAMCDVRCVLCDVRCAMPGADVAVRCPQAGETINTTKTLTAAVAKANDDADYLQNLTFYCQHGGEECAGNAVESCIQDKSERAQAACWGGEFASDFGAFPGPVPETGAVFPRHRLHREARVRSVVGAVCMLLLCGSRSCMLRAWTMLHAAVAEDVAVCSEAWSVAEDQHPPACSGSPA